MNLKLKKTIVITLSLVGALVVWSVLLYLFGFAGLGILDYNPQGMSKSSFALLIIMLIVWLILAVITTITLIVIWVNYLKIRNKVNKKNYFKSCR